MITDRNLLLSGSQNYLNKNTIIEIIDSCYQVLGLSQNNVISIVFCGSEELKTINGKYRGVDSYTDVISFPADDGQGIYKFDSNGDIYLGEILIDVDYIKNHSNSDIIEKEIIKVVIHGFLHLLGFDHLNTKQKTKMQEIENLIINSLGRIN